MNTSSKPDLVLLHNPSCSKSRAAKQWLDEQGVAYGLREYLENPLGEQELLELAGKLDLPLKDWVRDAGAVSASDDLSEVDQNESLAGFLVSNPAAMQRPILIRGDRARIGRPLESLQDLL